MKISLTRPYLSIIEPPPAELPNFTIITGLNGAGKTHLLRALVDGEARADCAPDQNRDIRMFNWSNLVPNEEGDFTSETLMAERAQVFNSIHSLYGLPWGHKELQRCAIQAGVKGQILNNPFSLITASAAELEDASPGIDGQAAQAAIKNANDALRQNLIGNLPQEYRAPLEQVSALANRPLTALRREDIMQHLRPRWGQAEIFQQSFARLFVA